MTHTPFYIRPNNVPPELVFETRRQDLELDKVDGKILKKSITVFSREITSNVSRSPNITKTKLLQMLMQTMSIGLRINVQ